MKSSLKGRLAEHPINRLTVLTVNLSEDGHFCKLFFVPLDSWSQIWERPIAVRESRTAERKAKFGSSSSLWTASVKAVAGATLIVAFDAKYDTTSAVLV